MGGLRNESELIKVGAAFDPDNSRINFACPSLKGVLNFKPMGAELPDTFEPGLMQDMIAYKANNDKDATKRSNVLMLDGKKMKRSTDVDFLGCEQGQTLKARQEERKRKNDILSNAIETLSQVEEQNISDTPEKYKEKIFPILLSLVLLFSTVLKELRKLKSKKEYSLCKLKELTGSEWRKSKYSYSIDLVMTLLWKIENCIDKCFQILSAVCKAGAYLNNAGHLFANQSVVDLKRQKKLRILKPVHMLPLGDQSETSVIKQRSEKWIKDRKKMKVTGSTIYRAIGLDSLKTQKEHFDQKIYGIDNENISEAQQKAMDHGTQCEVHHLATMCSIIMPFLYPDSIFFEEGYYVDRNVLVSPDGSISLNDGTPLFAFEGKSPMQKQFQPTLHETVPTRYIPQTLYGSRALKTEGTLYLCWTERSCSLFKVPFSETLCHDIDQETETLYLVENPKRPSKVSENSKKIKRAISKHASECIFLGEFPSVKGKLDEISAGMMDDTSSPYVTQSPDQTSLDPPTYNDLQRILLLGKEVIADSYELQRNMATQVVVYLLADLDRYWKEEKPHAIPVLYFYRGYNLSMQTTKQITEMCKTACRETGLDVRVTAADGEFNSIMVRGCNNRPLTQHQLSKDVWEDLGSLKKDEMIQIFIKNCKPFIIERPGNQKDRVLETSGRSMGRIKTPNKGWEKQSKRQKEDDRFISIENEDNECEVNVSEEIDEGKETESAILIQDADSIEPSEQQIPANLKDIWDGLKRINPEEWTGVTESVIADLPRSAESLKKLVVKELSEIAKCLNRRNKDKKMHLKTSGVGKAQLINSISKQVGDVSQVEGKPRTRKRKLQSLKELENSIITSKAYPKKVLKIALANYLWREKVKEWKQNACVAQTVEIRNESQKILLTPYYVPDKGQDGEFEVFVYDRTHLGSNLRKAVCLNKVTGISKKAWDVVTHESPKILNPVLVEVSPDGKIVNQMKEAFAKNMVSEALEKCIIENGYGNEGNFCRVIREGLFEAECTPGINAFERCEKRMELINWLDSGVDFGEFPPYGGSIKGMSTILYEELRASTEAKLYLYAISKTQTYSARAPNTLCSENFFSTMQEMDPWGQGVLTADGIQKHITDFTSITALKMKEERSFYIKTKRDKVYPVPSASTNQEGTNESSSWLCSCRRDGFIKCIIPKYHFFDTDARARGKRRQSSPFQFGDINDPLRGDEPVRQRYGYKLKDHHIYASKRLIKPINHNSN